MSTGCAKVLDWIDSVTLVLCPCLPNPQGYQAIETDDIDMTLTQVDDFQPEDMDLHENECVAARSTLLPQQRSVFDVLTLRGQSEYLVLTPLETLWFWRCKSFDMGDFLMSGAEYRGEVIVQMRDEMKEEVFDELSADQGELFDQFSAVEVESYFAMTQTERIVTWVLTHDDRATYMGTDTRERESWALSCIFGSADAAGKKEIMSRMSGPQRLVFMALVNPLDNSEFGSDNDVAGSSTLKPSRMQFLNNNVADFNGGAAAATAAGAAGGWPKPFGDTGEIPAWYMGSMPIDMASRLVRLEEIGAYVVRDRDTQYHSTDYDHSYDLTINAGGEVVKHYRIRQNVYGGYFVGKRVSCNTIGELLAHYTESADGMAAQLTRPCPRPNFKYGFESVLDGGNKVCILRASSTAADDNAGQYGEWNGVRDDAAGAGAGSAGVAGGAVATNGVRMHPNGKIEWQDLSHIFGKAISRHNCAPEFDVEYQKSLKENGGTASAPATTTPTTPAAAAAGATDGPPPLPPARLVHNEGQSGDSPPPPLPPRSNVHRALDIGVDDFNALRSNDAGTANTTVMPRWCSDHSSWAPTSDEGDVDFVAAAAAGKFSKVNRNSSVGGAAQAATDNTSGNSDGNGGGGGGDSGIGVTRADLLLRSRSAREADATAGAGAAVMTTNNGEAAAAGAAADGGDGEMKMPFEMPETYEDEGTDSGSDEPKGVSAVSAPSTPPNVEEVPPPPPPRPSLMDPDLGRGASVARAADSNKQHVTRPTTGAASDPYGDGGTGGSTTPTRIEDFAGGLMALQAGMHTLVGVSAKGVAQPEPVIAKVCTECDEPCVGEAKFCPMCGADALEDRRPELWAMGIPVD